MTFVRADVGPAHVTAPICNEVSSEFVTRGSPQWHPLFSPTALCHPAPYIPSMCVPLAIVHTFLIQRILLFPLLAQLTSSAHRAPGRSAVWGMKRVAMISAISNYSCIKLRTFRVYLRGQVKNFAYIHGKDESITPQFGCTIRRQVTSWH